MGIEVHGYCDDVSVACPLSVSEQSAFDPVAACKYPQFTVSHGRASVVMWVQGHDDIFSVLEVIAHVFYLGGVNMRH